jgi:hypothetical protein
MTPPLTGCFRVLCAAPGTYEVKVIKLEREDYYECNCNDATIRMFDFLRERN